MKRFLNAILALTILAIFFFLVYLVLARFFTWVVSLQSDLSASVITASATAFVAIITIVLSKYYERQSIVLQEIREKKIPVYLELMNFLHRKILFADKIGEEQPDEQETMKFLADFTEKIIVWGDVDVIRTFGRFRTQAIEGESVSSLFTYEKLMFAIRKDLGLSNTKLRKGDILRLFVNDIDKYL